MAEAYESSLWAIAVKGTENVRALQEATKEFAKCDSFRIPGAQLRVGTLDSLMSLSDDLTKSDIFADQTVTKMYKQLLDLKPEATPDIVGVPTVTYTTMRWEWDEAKFQLKQPLREMCEGISQRIAALDEELKAKVTEMNVLKGSLQGAERKMQGNLMVRGLADVIKKEDVVESEYMMTVYVVVPKYAMKDCETSYEKMAQYIVPKSGHLLMEDSEYGLYSVVLFKKSFEDFKHAAREKRLTLREFIYSEGAVEEEARKKKADAAELERLKGMLYNWCRINYAECYGMLLHLKAVRVFVESVLRFGLTATYAQGMVPNFKSFLLQPKKGKSETLRKALAAMYSGSAAMMEGEEESVAPGAGGEFYPYVYTLIETEPNISA